MKAQITVIMCMCRYDGNTKEASFAIGLQAIEASRVDEVKNIIQKTFEHVAQYVIACCLLYLPIKDCIIRFNLYLQIDLQM